MSILGNWSNDCALNRLFTSFHVPASKSATESDLACQQPGHREAYFKKSAQVGHEGRFYINH
jgi:hypothetical protein